MKNNFWNERYSDNEFAYGEEPNTFFREQILKLKPGNLLMLAEGEGRNAVFASIQKWQVDAIDFSEAAKEKALTLAEKHKVKFNYIIGDLSNYIPKENYYDALGIIFVHLNKELSKKVHSNAIKALKPGGKIILEVFSKEQLGKKSGGPQNLEALYSLEEIANDFSDLQIELLENATTVLSEGKYHEGEASVIRLVGTKN